MGSPATNPQHAHIYTHTPDWGCWWLGQEVGGGTGLPLRVSQDGARWTSPDLGTVQAAHRPAALRGPVLLRGYPSPHLPSAVPACEESSCSFRSVSCWISRMDSTRSCSRSSIWRTSTPMSESRPRSASELSKLTVAKSRMPGERHSVGNGGWALVGTLPWWLGLHKPSSLWSRHAAPTQLCTDHLCLSLHEQAGMPPSAARDTRLRGAECLPVGGCRVLPHPGCEPQPSPGPAGCRRHHGLRPSSPPAQSCSGRGGAGSGRGPAPPCKR